LKAYMALTHMESLLQPASEFIGRHHDWAGLVLAVATFLESLLLIGAFVPATALMLLAGGLVAGGFLEPLPVIAGCTIGAVLGDGVSFAIGRRFGARALRHRSLIPHRRHVARTRLLCSRHGATAVFMGRFLGPLRAFVPVVVGGLRMPQRTFQVANVVSGLVWVLVMLAPGYLAAKGMAQLELLSVMDRVTLLVGGGLAALVLGFAGSRAAKLLRRRSGRRAPPVARPEQTAA
jgi:membrane protein DedA with SNARE-associated domain